MTVFAKDADATTDYSVDWANWLTAGETISSADWTVQPAVDANALTLSGENIGQSLCGVFVSGGQIGERYKLVCRVATDAGRTADRSITLRIMER